MTRLRPLHLALVLAIALPGGLLAPAGKAAAESCVIVCSSDATPLELLAAREVRRYVYLRTGRLLAIEQTQSELLRRSGDCLVVTRADRPLARGLLSGDNAALAALGPEQYWLKTIPSKDRRAVLLTGGDEIGTLYAAYRFAEHLGVRFYLHGDVIPDGKISLRLPALDEQGKPLFRLRGIQPFHDFPEGPDWWNRDDYLAIISQLPKLRMNFIGLHTYPEKGPNAEPTVWIGLPDDVGDDGNVKFSYPSSYQNTLRGNWGYKAKKTSEFSFGAAELFERDDYGAEVMLGATPAPKTAEACNEIFDRTAAMLREAFTHAHRLGVKTCVGTETPLTVPKLLADRLQAQGKEATNAAVLQELYEGIFRRIGAAYPLDYYWFWTPEDWTWKGAKPEHIAATTNDLLAAIAAARKVEAPFQLATCGWVLGPQQDRALFDRILPEEIAVSCINREVGKTPVEPGFAKVTGRGKWAIPWLEDDPALTSPQLWAGRMRRDAADARRYVCDGLMGIHWRTRVLGPAVSALAQAAWEQGDWNTSSSAPEPPRIAGAVGGQFANFPTNAIAGTEAAPLYQSVRYNVSAYHLPVPEGSFSVTLKFCELNYKATGQRVFGVKLQGRPVLEELDIFAKAGPNRALDYTFDDIAVTNGWLDIDFTPVVEYPSIAGISVRGSPFTQNINCGGPAYADYAADWPASPPVEPRFPSTTDFYSDWAQHQFGGEIAPQAAAIFERMDGKLPRPSDWVEGPGGIRPDARLWNEVSKRYSFVDELAALSPKVKGPGNRERFDWWVNTFRYMKAMAHVNCTWALSTNAVARVKAEPDAAARKEIARTTALPLRRELVQQVGEVYRYLLATVSNPGELGTVANWEQHLLPGLLTKPGKELNELLGEDLPADAQPPLTYRGPTRVIVPTLRSSFAPDEPLSLKVIILAEQSPRHATLHWRRMGRGKFASVPLRHLERGVYLVEFPAKATAAEDLEYFVEVLPQRGEVARFPVTAPRLNQTLVAEAR